MLSLLGSSVDQHPERFVTTVVRRALAVGAVVAGIMLTTSAPVQHHEVPMADKDELIVPQSQTEAPVRPEPVRPVTLTTTGSSVYVPPEPVQEPPYDPCTRDEWGVQHNDDCLEAMGY